MPNYCFKKPIKVIGITFIGAVAFLIFVLISPLLLFNIEDQLLADELNNPYIGKDYSGWKSLYVDDFGNILIPCTWTINHKSDEKLYYIDDGSNSIISYAIVLCENDSFYELVISNADSECFDVLIEYDPDFISIEGSKFYRCTLVGCIAQNSFHCLELRSAENETKLYLLFPSDNGVDCDELREIAEAINYSHIYQ